MLQLLHIQTYTLVCGCAFNGHTFKTSIQALTRIHTCVQACPAEWDTRSHFSLHTSSARCYSSVNVCSEWTDLDTQFTTYSIHNFNAA